jgi:hypothetical protein
VISSPSKMTRPLEARTKPTMVLKAVDLPAPLGPITLTISPAYTWSVTSWRMGTLP